MLHQLFVLDSLFLILNCPLGRVLLALLARKAVVAVSGVGGCASSMGSQTDSVKRDYYHIFG
ncbi:hypothetical protein LKK83_20995 [Phormidium sp. CCY1219]|nr:hypothetical protein [Phormidium sp. CCY1219]